MADYKSSLPVRTEADADERVQVKIVDTTTVSQQMIVDADSNAHVEVHGNNPAGGDEVLRMSELGHAAIDGVYDATNNSDPSQAGLVVHTRAASPGDAEQVIRQTGISNGTVHAADVALHDEAGAPFSSSNPLPVYMAPTPGTEVTDYSKATAVAAGASSTHTYAVASGVFELRSVLISSTGRAGFEIQYYDGVTAATIAMAFNSTANPNFQIDFPPYLVVGAAGKEIRVVKTNRENSQAQDLYSTVMGLIQ
jgi:hypothetical protein